MEEEQVSTPRRLSARLQTKPKVVREYYQDCQDREWAARAAKQKAKKNAAKRPDNFVVEKQSLKKYYDDEDWSVKSAYQEDDDNNVKRVKEKKVKKTPLKSKPANASVAKKTKPVKPISPEKPMLSAYELERQRNIEERQKMFEMLQLGVAKKLFAEALSGPVKRKAEEVEDDNGSNKDPAKIPRLDKPKRNHSKPNRPLQVVLRERKTKMNYAVEFPRYTVSLSNGRRERPKRIDSDSEHSESSGNSLENRRRPPGLRMRLRGQKIEDDEDIPEFLLDKRTAPSIQSSVTLNNSYVDQGSIEESTSFVAEMLPFLVNEEPKVVESSSMEDFVQSVKAFELNDMGQVIESYQRICSLAWHSNSRKPILAVGGSKGTIGFWDVNNQDSDLAVRRYDVHESSVTGLSFDRFDPLRLFTSSRDGSVFWLDISSGIFDEVYSVPISSATEIPTHHVQKDASTLLLSLANGEVVMIDLRAASVAARVLKRIKCFDGSIASLSIHPLNNDLLLVSSDIGEAAVFDLGQLPSSREAAKPIVTFPQSNTRLHGAHFSPITGTFVSTLSDNALSIFNIEGITGGDEADLKQCWNLDFYSCAKTALNASVWHPEREDVVFVGGFDDPKRVDMFGVTDGRIVHSFQGMSHELCNLNAFHPSLPILAGTTRVSSVYIFRPPTQL